MFRQSQGACCSLSFLPPHATCVHSPASPRAPARARLHAWAGWRGERGEEGRERCEDNVSAARAFGIAAGAPSPTSAAALCAWSHVALAARGVGVWPPAHTKTKNDAPLVDRHGQPFRRVESQHDAARHGQKLEGVGEAAHGGVWGGGGGGAPRMRGTKERVRETTCFVCAFSFVSRHTKLSLSPHIPPPQRVSSPDSTTPTRAVVFEGAEKKGGGEQKTLTKSNTITTQKNSKP